MIKNLISLENELEGKIKDLKATKLLLAIKAEFEAEGTRIDELAILSELCCKNNIPLTLKIGGPSAQRDFYEAFQLGANNILIPMMESKYALSKSFSIYEKMINIFTNLKKSPNLSFNIESKLSVKNIDSILEYIYEKNLPISEIVIGRTDLSKSLEISDVNSEKIFKISKSIIDKRRSLNINLGGNLSKKSFTFIKKLTQHGLHSFESRKCTFQSAENLSQDEFDNLINIGLEFELAWLEYKKKLYSERSEEENNRITSIKGRLMGF